MQLFFTRRLLILALPIRLKGKRVGVFVVGCVMLLVYTLPYPRVNRREESIGIIPSVVHMRDMQLINHWHKLTINLATTYDKHIILHCQHRLQMLDRVRHIYTLVSKRLVASQNNIPTIRQWTTG